MNCRLFAKTFCVVSIAFFAIDREGLAQGWSQEAAAYGCGLSEGLAYQNGEASVRQALSGYQGRCESEGGTFSLSTSHGFCTPYNPNSHSCPSECLVRGVASCSIQINYVVDEIAVHEASTESNQDGSLDPGERVSIDLKFNNLGRQTLKNVSAFVKFDGPDEILEITQRQITAANINPGETKTLSLEGKISPKVKCGSKGFLRFVIENSIFRRSYMSIPFTVGKLAADPIVIESNNTGIRLKPEGVSYMLQDIANEELDVFQVHLTYLASARVPSKYRMWVTAPNKATAWANRVGEKQVNVNFSEDLSETLQGSRVKGRWFLSGDMQDPSNSVSVNYLKLTIVPNKFVCNW